ncbi:MAG TPA: cytochrome c [Candidatus Deferrimicrobiaceae bacterium]
MRRPFAGFLAFLLLGFTLPACEKIDRNMWDNPAFGPQETPQRLPPEGSVPTKGVAPRPSMADAAKLASPLSGSADDVAGGKALFGIFCVPCHGESGKGDGPVGLKLTPRPSNIGPSGMLPSLSDGELFTIVTNGAGAMPSFAADLAPEARWRIIAWLRASRR